MTATRPTADPDPSLERIAGLEAEVSRLEWSARLLGFQQRTLEDVAGDLPLDEILSRMLLGVEHLAPGLLASVLFLRSGQLYPGAAPNLPEAYTAALAAGVPVGPACGSCGTAAHRREPVYVADLTTDPLWEGARQVAAPYGLRACWSVPILTASDDVLGTFALYYREPRLPTPAEVVLVETAARLARVAIEKRRADAAVRESEERFRAFMDHCPAAAFIKDADGRYVYVNPVWLAQFDPPPDDWAGKTDYDFWPRDTAYLFRASDRRCLQAGVIQSEETGMTPAGDRRAWLVLKFPLDRDGQRFVGGMAWDVTGRQAAEAAARDAQARLLERERREKEIVAADLEASRAEVVRSTRLAALGQIAASVAHDLRNPLGVVRNAAYYLRRRFPSDDPKWAEYLGLIDREVAACDGIIGNLLELARPKPPVAEPTDLGETVRLAFARLRAPGGTRLVLNLDPDPLVVTADPVQLRQVFDNLMKNAADAVEGAGEIQVTAAAGPDGVRVVVADTGPGVPPEARAQLFQPLFTTKAKGTGLGLWICLQVLERHGGSIRLIDAGPGAGFEIRLPGRPPEAEPRSKLSG